MHIDDIIPTTIEGIKKLAKKISNSQGIQYSKALDSASIKAQYNNYEHAFNSLSSSINKPLLFKVFITAYWTQNEPFDSGRETLEIWIKKPLKELITSHQRGKLRATRPFKLSGPDHLVSKDPYRSQGGARSSVCFAARNIEFINVTDLMPSSRHLAYPKGNPSNAVPKNDHASTWCDAEGRQLYIDEPYGISINDPERVKWSNKFNQRIVLTKWPGMYYPGGSEMFLISDNDNGVPLVPLLNILDKLPYPVTSEDWEGESADYRPVFISPGKLQQTEINKLSSSKKTTVPRGERNTVPYIATFVGRQSKPMGRMAIKDHRNVGHLLIKVLANTHYRPSVYNRIDSVRSELDEWAQKEYQSNELSNDEFFNLYYPQHNSTFLKHLDSKTINLHVRDLNKAKAILVSSYPECSPLKKMIVKIDSAIKWLSSWK